MTLETNDFNQQLRAFLDASPTPFHAVSSMGDLLTKAGFTQLNESDDWALKSGDKHFVSRNGSSIIAFTVGSEPLNKNGLRMAGAHTDSPCLMVKPQPEISKNGYFQLGVEVYGGALLNPWFDRDLSIAGRLVYRDGNQQLKQQLVDFERPVAMIPSLAIHLDREANKGRTVNAQKDIPPILMLSNGKEDFRALLAEEFLPAGAEVLDYELCFYDTQGAAMVGINNEFLASARLDNLLSCFVATQALLQADSSNTCLMVCNDHEEVGSVSAVGADGPFLEAVIARLNGCHESHERNRVIEQSLMVSCDNAHAAHPNYLDKHDSSHVPVLNGGPVIKVNVKQRYATTSVTASLFRQFCASVDVPVQTFVSRSDLGCGSTIGPITASRLGVPTLDVGIPQLAMHSCREVTGSEDPLRLTWVLKEFFNKPGNLNVESA
ncbi:M18 family aminopeptidase [Porticoccaceae bacterium]|nr:M18 family aminopeptidase [Porticoccaceae bacterium]MDB4076475.1 M18 family aminopeptidase [Porticoccaceae bacterium]MDB4308491.1 M18 family aminopeptidase [Porticoccaceae bacterium]